MGTTAVEDAKVTWLTAAKAEGAAEGQAVILAVQADGRLPIVKPGQGIETASVRGGVVVDMTPVGPKFSVMDSVALIRIAQKAPEGDIAAIDIALVEGHAEAEASPMYAGAGVGFALVNGSASIFDITLGASLDTGIGVKDYSVEVEVAGTGVTVGKKISISVFGTSFGIDLVRTADAAVFVKDQLVVAVAPVPGAFVASGHALVEQFRAMPNAFADAGVALGQQVASMPGAFANAAVAVGQQLASIPGAIGQAFTGPPKPPREFPTMIVRHAGQLAGQSTVCTPCVHGDYILFRGTEDTLWRVRKDGSDFRGFGGAKTASTPAVADDVVVLQGTDNGLYRVGLDGTGLTKIGATRSAPVIVGDVVVYRNADDDDRVTRVNVSGADRRGFYDAYTYDSPFVDDGYVYFRGTNDKLWRSRLDAPGDGPQQVGRYATSASPFASGGYVYFRGTDDKLWRVNRDGTDGTVLGDNRTRSTPFVHNGVVYFEGTDHRLFRIGVDGSRQYLIAAWKAFSSPVAADDAVYFRGESNELVKIEF